MVEAISRQAKKLIHISGTDYYYPQQVELAQLLVDVTPGKDRKRVFFCNPGPKRWKPRRNWPGTSLQRPYFISFFGAFHGRTMGRTVAHREQEHSEVAFRGCLVGGVFHAPYAYCYRCMFNREYPSCDFECVKYIENTLMRTVAPADEGRRDPGRADSG